MYIETVFARRLHSPASGKNQGSYPLNQFRPGGPLVIKASPNYIKERLLEIHNHGIRDTPFMDFHIFIEISCRPKNTSIFNFDN